jgi:hypothetical protein
MRPGQVYSLRLSQAAPDDFRFLLDSGHAAEARRVTVCQVSALIATAQGLRRR